MAVNKTPLYEKAAVNGNADACHKPCRRTAYQIQRSADKVVCDAVFDGVIKHPKVKPFGCFVISKFKEFI